MIDFDDKFRVVSEQCLTLSSSDTVDDDGTVRPTRPSLWSIGGPADLTIDEVKEDVEHYLVGSPVDTFDEAMSLALGLVNSDPEHRLAVIKGFTHIQYVHDREYWEQKRKNEKLAQDRRRTRRGIVLFLVGLIVSGVVLLPTTSLIWSTVSLSVCIALMIVFRQSSLEILVLFPVVVSLLSAAIYSLLHQ